MRFGLVHRIMSDTLALFGVLALISTATIGRTTSVLVLVGLLLSVLVPDSWQGYPAIRRLATVGPLALFLIEAGRLAMGFSPIDVAVEFVAFLQVFRIATRRGAAHDQQVIMLALFHFIAGTVLGGNIAFGVCLLGFLIAAPGALVLSHLRREVEGNYRQGARDRTGLPVDVPRILRSRRVVGSGFLLMTCLLSLPILLFMTTVFVLFPRVGLSLMLISHPHSGRMVGFSDHVDLGQVGALQNDPTIALRFTPAELPANPPLHMPLRLRGTAFDSYSGHAWQRTLSDRHAVGASSGNESTFSILRSPRATDHKIAFELEPLDPPVIFLPPESVAVKVKVAAGALLDDPIGLHRGQEGDVRYTGNETRGLRYDVYTAAAGETFIELLSARDRERYLAASPIPDRIGELAHKWTDGETTPLQKAITIEQHLKHDYGYSIDSPSGAAREPVDDFLFVSHRGHCEFFSTAMALMLREVAIPSRNVTGFVGGTYNRFGQFYAVRQGDAHSWVEAYIDDPAAPGWRTFDPTPSTTIRLDEKPRPSEYARDLMEAISQRWNRYVVGYDLRTQTQILDRVLRRGDYAAHTAGFFTHKRQAWLFASAVALAVSGWIVWRFRLFRKRNPHVQKPPEEAFAPRAVELYARLESTLSRHGLSRPLSVPPLRHAETIRQGGARSGDEIIEITELYLSARFGGVRFTEEELRTIDQRIASLDRQLRTESQPQG